MTTKPNRLESDNTSDAHKFAERRGWFTFKVESPTFNGLPDRCYIRRGRVVWVEWKRPGRGESGLSPIQVCLLYTSPSPRDRQKSRMPSSA